MGRETLVDFFADLSRIDGAFLVYDNGYRPRSFTYSEIAGMARAFALRLREARIAKGDHVLVWCENRPGWIAALWGCILEGVVLVPLDYRVSGEFVQRVARLVSAKAMMAGDQVSVPEPFDAPVWRAAEVEEQSAAALEPVQQAAAGDTVEIVFTSGATAEPKGVVITHRNLLANMVPVEREINKYKKWGRPFFPLRFLNLLPLSHLFGQAMAAFIPPMLAGVVIFMSGFEPAEIVRQIHQRRVSLLVCVPKMLDLLRGFVAARFPESANPAERGRWWMRWWRYRRVHRAFGFKFWAFIVGAAPLEAELEQFWSRLGFLVIQGYGLTETAPIVTLNHPFHARSGTVGKPIAGVQVKIAEDGEILVRGANVTSGYFGDADAQAFEDGWLHTGDLGEIAPDGSLLVHGRKKDVIVTPEGLNVFPEDIERVLEHTEGVKEAAAVGPDRVHAVVVLAPGGDAEKAASAANRRLEEYQRIRTIRVWPGESLPRTEGTGKLKRAQIRAWLEGAAPVEAGKGRGVEDLLRRLAPGRTISPETTLEELGLSSLERIELLSGLEQKLGGPRDEAALGGSMRVADLMNLPPAASEPAMEYPRWSRSGLARAWRRMFVPAAILPLTRFFARLTVRGRENLRDLRGPVIFASNHQSHMDVPTILAAMPARWRYRIAPAMAKEYFEARFHPEAHSAGERLVQGLEYFLVVLNFNVFLLARREAGAGAALHYAGELASEGWSILIFPEGERTGHGELLPFQPGVGLMASRLALPVVPVRIRGLERVLGKGAHHATRGPVEVVFGEAIQPEGDWREIAPRLREVIEKL